MTSTTGGTNATRATSALKAGLASVLVVLLDVPASVQFLPTSTGPFVATLLALMGMMAWFVGATTERNRDETTSELRRLYANAQKDEAVFDRRTGDRS